MLLDKIEAIDFKYAANDVRPFIKNDDNIDYWSREMFQDVTQMFIKAQ